MKSVLLPDHIPLNNYELVVPDSPGRLWFTAVSGLEQTLETVDLPDRTKASGGNMTAVEFTASHPKHHAIEDAYLEAWFQMGRIAAPTYKKLGTLLVRSISGLQTRSYSLFNLFISARSTPDLEMENEGELFQTEWTFMCDDILAA